jgi:hypothetical protein
LTGGGAGDIVARVKASVAVVALLVALSTPASAAPPGERLAIAVFAVTGQPLAPEAQAKLHASLRGGLAASGFDVVPDADVDKAIATGGLGGCDTLSCLRRIGELVMARRVIKATVEVIGNTHVVSQVEMIDLGDGKVVASAKDNCDVCTMKEVNDGLSNAAAALRMQIEPPQPPQPPRPPQPETPSQRPLWIGLAGGAAGLLAGSVVAFAVSYAYDGRHSCDSSLPANDGCPNRYNGTPGIVIGAVGMPLAAVATSVFAWRALRTPPKRVALVPSLGMRAAALDVVLRF